MIKFLFKFLCFTAVIMLIAGAGIYCSTGKIIKTAVEKFVPAVTQTAVQLDNVDLSLLSGKIAFKGLSIANPERYGSSQAFSVGNIAVLFDPKSLLSDKIVISQILIDKTAVNVEAAYKDGKITSNLMDIQKNAESFLIKGSAGQTPEKKQAQDEHQSNSKERHVVIQDLQINGSELTVSILKKTLTVPLPDIRQKNIGEKKQEMTWQNCIAYVFNLIAAESVKETVSAVQKAVREGALNIVNISGGAADEVKESAGGILKNVGKISGHVKGLLSKD